MYSNSSLSFPLLITPFDISSNSPHLILHTFSTLLLSFTSTTRLPFLLSLHFHLLFHVPPLLPLLSFNLPLSPHLHLLSASPYLSPCLSPLISHLIINIIPLSLPSIHRSSTVPTLGLVASFQ